MFETAGITEFEFLGKCEMICGMQSSSECDEICRICSQVIIQHPLSQRVITEEPLMAAMKPRTGDGPMEATKEGRGVVMRVPTEGGGRLVIELTPEEASELSRVLADAC